MPVVIIYTAVDNGIEGRDKDNVLYASFSEEEIHALHGRDKSKQWRTIKPQMVDFKVARKQALAKLNGIDRLVLNLPNWIEEN